jgi:hypothetical protein
MRHGWAGSRIWGPVRAKPLLRPYKRSDHRYAQVAPHLRRNSTAICSITIKSGPAGQISRRRVFSFSSDRSSGSLIGGGASGAAWPGHRRDPPGNLSARSIQLGRAVAPSLAQELHRIRGPKEGTVASSGQSPMFTARSCRSAGRWRRVPGAVPGRGDVFEGELASKQLDE